MTRVCILDYGSGNTRSVFNAFSRFAECEISNDPERLEEATHLVLPGVGSFKNSMKLINETIPIAYLKQQIFQDKPFLGICVGMQVLTMFGEEFGLTEGLQIIEGTVSRIECPNLPLPHIGWNNLVNIKESIITRNITDEDDFYFVHSYAIKNLPEENKFASTEYGETFPSIVGTKNIFGVQFHPEKSQKSGEKIILNFLDLK
jgi:glutamine amidotransferase